MQAHRAANPAALACLPSPLPAPLAEAAELLRNLLMASNPVASLMLLPWWSFERRDARRLPLFLCLLSAAAAAAALLLLLLFPLTPTLTLLPVVAVEA